MDIPDKGKQFRILGIDPGSGETGFSLVDHEPVSGLTTLLFHYTFTEKEAVGSVPLVKDMHGYKMAKHVGHRNFFRWLLEIANPDVVVSESPFMARSSQAFRVLSELTVLFQTAAIDDNPHRDFLYASPQAVKSAMGVTKDTGNKDLMYEALKARRDLSYANDINIDELTEHTVDSTCVTLWFIKHVFGNK